MQILPICFEELVKLANFFWLQLPSFNAQGRSHFFFWKLGNFFSKFFEIPILKNIFPIIDLSHINVIYANFADLLWRTGEVGQLFLTSVTFFQCSRVITFFFLEVGQLFFEIFWNSHFKKYLPNNRS